MKSDQASDLELVGDSSSIEATAGSSLLPADRGKDAWLFLAGSFVIEALVWGTLPKFGHFSEKLRDIWTYYYSLATSHSSDWC